MSRLAFILAVLALALPGVAGACGPTRQKVVETIELEASVDQVWAIIGNFQDMRWHPAVASIEGEGGNDVGARRVLTLKSGGRIAESLTKYDAVHHSMSYEITEVDVSTLPVTAYSAGLSVKGDGARTTVEWRTAFSRGDTRNNPPPELSDDAAIKAVENVLKAGLGALRTRLGS